MTATLIFSSCSTMYNPSNTATSLFQEKGEKQIELTTSWTGMHLSGNYAYDNNIFHTALNFSFGVSYTF